MNRWCLATFGTAIGRNRAGWFILPLTQPLENMLERFSRRGVEFLCEETWSVVLSKYKFLELITRPPVLWGAMILLV